YGATTPSFWNACKNGGESGDGKIHHRSRTRHPNKQPYARMNRKNTLQQRTKGGRMHSKLTWAACLAALVGCIGCSNLKYLPEGEQLYVKGEVEIETDTIPVRYIEPLSTSLEELLRPKPNTTILGMR